MDLPHYQNAVVVPWQRARVTLHRSCYSLRYQTGCSRRGKLAVPLIHLAYCWNCCWLLESRMACYKVPLLDYSQIGDSKWILAVGIFGIRESLLVIQGTQKSEEVCMVKLGWPWRPLAGEKPGLVDVQYWSGVVPLCYRKMEKEQAFLVYFCVCS